MSLLTRTLRITGIVIAAIVAVFLLLLFYLWASGRVWYPRQRRRVEALLERPVLPAGEDRHSVAPLDDGLPLNTLRMIASHNSYHVEPDWIRRILIGLAEPQEPPRLRYTHETLWDQLEEGVRSFELDIRARRNRFTITHVPLVDNRGPNPDFPLALREIVTWSKRHPGHVPVIVLLELKSDWMFLDPGLKPWDTDTLDRLDQTVLENVPAERLFKPGEFIDLAGLDGPAGSLAEVVRQHGWPELGLVRDKIIFVIHTDHEIDPLYVAGDARLQGRAMFTSQPGSSAGERAGDRPDALFAIHNDPDPDAIASLTAAGLVVRTRADGDGSFTLEQREAALRSAAQIVSTDLPPGHPNDPQLGLVEFAPGRSLNQSRTLAFQADTP